MMTESKNKELVLARQAKKLAQEKRYKDRELERPKIKKCFDDLSEWGVTLKAIGVEVCLQILGRKMSQKSAYDKARQWKSWANSSRIWPPPKERYLNAIINLTNRVGKERGLYSDDWSHIKSNLVLARCVDIEKTSREIHDRLSELKKSVYKIMEILGLSASDCASPLGIWDKAKTDAWKCMLEKIRNSTVNNGKWSDVNEMPELKGLFSLTQYHILAAELKTTCDSILAIHPNWDVLLRPEEKYVNAELASVEKDLNAELENRKKLLETYQILQAKLDEIRKQGRRVSLSELSSEEQDAYAVGSSSTREMRAVLDMNLNFLRGKRNILEKLQSDLLEMRQVFSSISTRYADPKFELKFTEAVSALTTEKEKKFALAILDLREPSKIGLVAQEHGLTLAQAHQIRAQLEGILFPKNYRERSASTIDRYE